MNAAALSLVSLALNLLLGGGLLAVWLRYRIQFRGEERIDFSTILDEVKEQRDKAWKHIDEQDARIAVLEGEIQGLRLARDLDPFPNWIVDLAGKYLFLNREFEKCFLEPMGKGYRDVVGKTHADVWPKSFCETLRSLDAAARKRPDGTARAATTVEIPKLGCVTVTVHKFPIRAKGVIVAFAGFITDVESDERVVR